MLNTFDRLLIDFEYYQFTTSLSSLRTTVAYGSLLIMCILVYPIKLQSFPIDE
jgi:hypothetical protein